MRCFLVVVDRQGPLVTSQPWERWQEHALKVGVCGHVLAVHGSWYSPKK